MADRNEIFRIILEGRDRLSKELDTVRKASDALDKSLNKLKRQKPDEFPLFGGGKASRGSGGQFIKKEEIATLDRVRQKIDDINRSISVLKRNKLKEGEFALFGGGRAVRGEDGRFIRVQDVTLLEKAKNRLDAIDKALVRIRTRARRGPLVEGEEAGAGATRLTRTPTGQFVRAQDLSLIKRVQRELAVLGRGIRTLQNETRQGIILGTENTIARLKQVENYLNNLKRKASDIALGSTPTRTGVDPDTGRFISVSNLNNFQKFVRAVQAGGNKIIEVNEKVAKSTKDLRTGFAEGFGISRETKRFIDERIKNSREEVRIEKDRIKETQEAKKLELSAENDRERKALFERLENLREADRITIREKRKAIAAARAENDVARREELEDEIAAIQARRRLRESEEKAELTAVFQAKRAQQRIEFVGELREVDTPDVQRIEREALEERAIAVNKIEGSFKRMGARAGLAFGDIVRGAQSARSGITDMDRDIRLVNNSFTRLGFAVGQIFKNFGQLVNLRWLFLTGILSTFFTLLVQIGTALVAVASSAIQAGAAIGGAFLSGIAQALPVVGLLAAALNTFNKVLDQVKLNEKLDDKVKDNLDSIRDAGQRLADAQYSLQKALEGVGDAQIGVVDANKELRESYKNVKSATEELRNAKVQAARDIVDANLEEKDAALSLAEAELGVLEAKKKLREEQKKARGDSDVDDARAALREAQDRLKIATAQADQSEISSAQQQLTLAEQNLNAVLDASESAKTELKEAELGVKRAVLTVEQARVRNQRAKKDAAEARKDGVTGSEVVQSAQKQLEAALKGVADSQRNVLLANRNVRDSLHQVAIAQREVAEARKEESDARKGQSQADKDAAAAFADLAPAEKKLFNSLTRLRKVFKDVFTGSSERDGILGPITEALARFADTLTKLLLDPKIQNAASTLAQSIADALDSFRQFVGSAEFKEALLFFTQKAADNIPRIVEGMLNLTQSFLDIAKAANPIFDRLIEGAVNLTGRLSRATSQSGEKRRPEEGVRGGVATINESGLDKFLGNAEKHLDSWLKLSSAIIGLIAAITGSAAADAGDSLIGRLTEKLNEFTDFIKNNPESVQKFFDDAVESITNLTSILGKLTEVLVKAFSSEEMQAFAEIMSEIIIPGLVGLIFFLGKVSQAILFLLDIPIVGDILKIALSFLVFEKGLNKLFPVTQKITDGIQKLGVALFRMFRILGIKGAFEYLRLSVVAFTKAVGQAIVAAGRFVLALGKSFIAVIGTAARAIGTVLVNAFRALKLSIRGLLLGTGIGALILAGILLIENWDKVKKAALILKDKLIDAFKRILDWFRNNWKKVLVGILLAPFLLGGAVFLAIFKFRDKILAVFKTIGEGIKNAFKGAFDWIREKFNDIVDWMAKQYKKLPAPIRAIISGAGKVAEGAGKVAEGVKSVFVNPIRRGGGGTVPGAGKGDTVPAMLTPGEWILNEGQQRSIAARMGMTVQQAKAVIFGTKSNSPPQTQAGRAPARGFGNKSAGAARNNGLGKKVQYYGDFNLVSQEDPDGVIIWFIEMADGSFGQVTARDAAKIQSSSGTWIPNYVKRSTAGFKQNIQKVVTGGISGFSMGGVVGSPAVQRFAKGGIVQAPGHGGTSSGGKVINQNFDVKTQGETDWGYVMRLGAIHAQESF